MAYQTGVSGSVGDLINAVAAFAVANGFESISQETIGSYTVRKLRKDGVFFNFEMGSAGTNLRLNTATGVLGTGRIEQEPGAAKASCKVTPIVGPHVGYHLFGDGQSVHVVVELVTGVFQHFSFGFITKAGNWTSGAFVSGNNWSDQLIGNPSTLRPWDDGYHSRHFDGRQSYGPSSSAINTSAYERAHLRATYAGQDIADFGGGSYQGNANSVYINSLVKGSFLSWGYELFEDSPNAWNTRTALIPIAMIIGSTYETNPANWLQVGVLPNAAGVNLLNLNPKETINSDWMVFPLCQKNGDGISYVNTQNVGMAYKK
jgi:hypothetical protein